MNVCVTSIHLYHKKYFSEHAYTPVQECPCDTHLTVNFLGLLPMYSWSVTNITHYQCVTNYPKFSSLKDLLRKIYLERSEQLSISTGYKIQCAKRAFTLKLYCRYILIIHMGESGAVETIPYYLLYTTITIITTTVKTIITTTTTTTTITTITATTKTTATTMDTTHRISTMCQHCYKN